MITTRYVSVGSRKSRQAVTVEHGGVACGGTLNGVWQSLRLHLEFIGASGVTALRTADRCCGRVVSRIMGLRRGESCELLAPAWIL